jgi:uncharacterized membrane protein
MKIGTTRVETFSDGVIAIIITITVLTIKIPVITNQPPSSWSFRKNLLEMLPYVISYAFSFLMIGIFWINHHHMFHLLGKTDESLLVQNLFFLFWMSLIPLGTVMISSNPKLPDSAALYGSILLLTTLSFAIMRAYTLKKNLVHKDADEEITVTVRGVSLRARTKSIIGTIAYLIAIPLAYLNVYLAYIMFLIPPVIFFIPDGIDDDRLAQKIDEKNAQQGAM